MAKAIPNRQPRTCGHCGDVAPIDMVLDGSDRCRACAQYRRAHGADRAPLLLLRKRARAMGMKACGGCMRALPLDRFHGSSHYGKQGACMDCQRDQGRQYALANPANVQMWQQRYQASGKSTIRAQRRRARKRSAYVAHVDPAAIFERDRWRCGLCRKSVDKRLRHPDPRSASIDHIIPLSKGGTHEPANVQLAHLGCNSAKRDRGGGEQLLLIG